ncbi:MAG TPA: mechanosensitive ion channel family protein [candidate division Zixibacteria bacterium]|nr:mechanosensitive ion channel family protein [candidate division Zixibacteria bacterium]
MSEDIQNWAIALGIFIGSIVVSWLIGFVLNQLQKRYFSKTETSLDDVTIGAIKAPLQLVVVVAGIELALRQADIIVDSKWQDTVADIFFVIYLLIVYVALLRLISAVTRWYAKEVVSQTDTELDDKFLSFFKALANTILTIIIIIMFLGRFGIEPSALITTLGIGTLAVALAAQETLSDIISGFIIMIDQPFNVGDRVEILDINTWGDVTEIGLRSTRVLTRDNRLVAIPNSVIGKGLVVNYSDPSTVYRVQTHIGVSYDTDLEKAREVMIEAIRAQEWVMHDEPIEALMLEFSSTAMVFRVRCWIEHYVEKRRAIDRMNTALYYAVGEAGIVIEPLTTIQLYPSTVAPDTIRNPAKLNE